MNLIFDKAFSKSLDKVSDASVLSKIELILLHMESAESISQVKGVKKMVGFTNYYRVRVGHYRVGLELIDDITVRLIVVLHRKDIYRKFP